MNYKKCINLFLALFIVSASTANDLAKPSLRSDRLSTTRPENNSINEDLCQQRRQGYIEKTVNSNHRNAYTELIRLNQGQKPDENTIKNHALTSLKKRKDAADFKLPAILNILYNFSDSNLLSKPFVQEAKQTLLNFKYWPDELADWTWKKTPQMKRDEGV